jgi:hypothetical protein
MATKNRTDLKSYFVKNAIPTEGNFVDLIDSQLNQSQDGVFKPDGDALSMVATPGDQKRVLRLYASYPAVNPDWMISLNPVQDPAAAGSASRLGFGITDGTGKTRLFIDAATGQLGVGTNTPQCALDVAGTAQANGLRGRYDLVLNDYRTVNPSSNVCLQSPPGDRDAWIYRDIAVGSASSNWGIYHRQIDTPVGNLPGNSIGFVGNTTLQAYIALGDGSAYFASKVGVGTTSPEASLHVTNGSRFTGGRHYFTDSEGKARVRVGACSGIAGIYAEDTQDILVGCDPSKTVHLGQPNTVTVQSGSLTLTGVLTPSVGNSESNGILFPKDPGAGGGDRAFIRYYVESGETTKLMIGCNNDADDRISLYQMSGERLTVYNGCVGINNTSPTSTLHVTGSLSATTKNFCIDHPLDPARSLVHSVLEGPEVAVFYRGEAVLVDGACEIGLPSYFEALTRKENRTVLVTPKLSDGEETSALAASGVADGRFAVRAIDPRNRKQRFFWEVKGVRADIDPLEVEPVKPDAPAPPRQPSPENPVPGTMS